jgi:hypothetical protein
MAVADEGVQYLCGLFPLENLFSFPINAVLKLNP